MKNLIFWQPSYALKISLTGGDHREKGNINKQFERHFDNLRYCILARVYIDRALSISGNRKNYGLIHESVIDKHKITKFPQSSIAYLLDRIDGVLPFISFVHNRMFFFLGIVQRLNFKVSVLELFYFFFWHEITIIIIKVILMCIYIYIFTN